MCKISIVTVCYNAAEYIEDTILSVIRQKYKNIEYIVVDGCSSDNTLEIIKKYENNISNWVSEKDNGIFDAMNKGINMATGEWILFLNAGDYLYNSDTLLDLFGNEKYYDACVLYGNCIFYSNDSIYSLNNKPFWNSKKIIKKMGISHQSIFVKVSIAKELLFDTSYKVSADYNMIYNIFKKGYKFQYVYKPICYMNACEGFSINNRLLQIKEEANIVGVNNNILGRLYIQLVLSLYRVKSFLRKYKSKKKCSNINNKSFNFKWWYNN